MNKLNKHFYEFLRQNAVFSDVTIISNDRFKVSCTSCEESFNNPRIHVLRKHLTSIKHITRLKVSSANGLTKKETVQRDKLLRMFTFLRFVNSGLVCQYCNLFFSCGASPSMIATHEKCRKHQELKFAAQHEMALNNHNQNNNHNQLCNRIEHKHNLSNRNQTIPNVNRYPGVIWFSSKDGSLKQITINVNVIEN